MHSAPDRLTTWVQRHGLVVLLAGVVLAIAFGTALPLAGLALLGFIATLTFLARSAGDAVTVLTVFIALVTLLPDRLIIVGTGDVGTPALAFGCVLLFLWVLGAVHGHKTRPALATRVVILLFFASVVATDAWAILNQYPGYTTSAIDRGLIFAIAMCGVALYALDHLKGRADVERLAWRMVQFSALVAVLGIIQFLVGWDPFATIHIPGLTTGGGVFSSVRARHGVARITATAGHPIEYSLILAMAFPMSLYFARKAWRERKELAPSLAALAIVMAIPTAVSRSGVVGLFVILLVLFPSWTSRERFYAIVSIPFMLLAARAAFPGAIGTITSLFTGASDDTSVTSRTEDYGRSVDYILETPILGRGFRVFDPTRFFLLDNQYLATLIEMGVVGLIALLALFFCGIAMASRVRTLARSRGDDDLRRFSTALLASLGAAVAGFATFDALGYQMITAMVMLLIAALTVLRRSAEPLRAPRPVEVSVNT